MLKHFISRRVSVSVLLFFFFFFFFISLLIGAIVIVCMDAFVTRSSFVSTASSLPSPKIEYKLNCSNGDVKRTCTINHPQQLNSINHRPCPEYFRWIHEDLRPWKQTGISREMVERGGGVAHFRLSIVDGKVFVKKYKKPFQTRDVFTIWGIVQLTRLYPGFVPDLELVFYCEDRPVINKHDYTTPNATSPPPVFHYCADDESLDIVFPDWTFWGWAETNVRPWESLLKDIEQGSKKKKWEDRVPYAFWKGNARVGGRVDLMKCNVSEKYDWNGRFYQQDWIKESKEGFKNSRLADQCRHRYKVYVEGQGWSVSEKYILACDSMTLLVKPRYYDFFIRSMRPMQHYWPIRNTNKCRDIKFAVEWGNNHTEQARAIGKEGSSYMSKNLSMINVYDYMFHLLREYAKLLRFKPSIPLGAEEVCSETMACSQTGLWQKFQEESMVKSPSDTPPCSLPPPYEPKELEAFLGEKETTMKRVEMWEIEYWESSNRKQ